MLQLSIAIIICNYQLQFMQHLWHLSEELVPLAFFDDGVSTDIKCTMVQDLKVSSNSNKLVFRASIELSALQLHSKSLDQIINVKSSQFLKMIISQPKKYKKYYYFIILHRLSVNKKTIQKVNKKTTGFLFINKNPVE